MARSVEFEIALFRAIIKHRPLGLNKHFAMIGVQEMLREEMGREYSSQQIWQTLAEMYNLDEMDSLTDATAEDLAASASSSSSSSAADLSSSVFVKGQNKDFSLDVLSKSDVALSDMVYDRRFAHSPSPEHRGNTPEPIQLPEQPYDPGSPLTEQEDVDDDGEDASESDKEQTREISAIAESIASVAEEEESTDEIKPTKKKKSLPINVKKGTQAKKNVKSSSVAESKRGVSGAAAASLAKKQERLAREEAAAARASAESSTKKRKR